MTKDTINFTLTVEESPSFDLFVESPDNYGATLDTAIEVTKLTGDIYDGEYTVDPSFEQQVLQTKNKTMEDDVTVNAIMVSRTTNLSGGYTVYIGGEINYG